MALKSVSTSNPDRDECPPARKKKKEEEEK
jgi:hypothetical protein